jgi:ABC-type Fe3+/spermidine/putrescine transport system ATPase subunit
LGSGQVQLAGTSEGTIIHSAENVRVPAGAAVRCLVRPEAVRLVDGTLLDNTLDVSIQEIILAGGVTKYVLALPDGTSVRATTLTNAARQAHDIGDRIRVGFAAFDVRILPDEPL